MEKSVPSAKKKFSIRDIMTIAAMMVICFIIMMVMSSLTLPFPLVYLYGSAGIDGFICAVFFLVAANRVNKHGLLFAWAGIYGLIQGVMGYMFLFPYFLAVGLIAELSMLGKDTYDGRLCEHGVHAEQHHSTIDCQCDLCYSYLCLSGLFRLENGSGIVCYHAYYIPDYLGRAQLADTHV